MTLEDFGYVDIEKKQKVQNQNYENQMHKKFKIGSTPSNDVQNLFHQKI